MCQSSEAALAVLATQLRCSWTSEVNDESSCAYASVLLSEEEKLDASA